ncbi:MAG: hypothetical protein CM1200mP20_01210 [Pseudomonadota bacterium]|nr:MAG: hypothetical protein CM1200mP20_01210 [Pseudomonadota bacterium]
MSNLQNYRVTMPACLTPRGGAVTGPVNIVIESGRIAQVSSTPIGACDSVFDLEAQRLMPGLCDAHVHVPGGNGEFSRPAGVVADVPHSSGV